MIDDNTERFFIIDGCSCLGDRCYFFHEDHVFTEKSEAEKELQKIQKIKGSEGAKIETLNHAMHGIKYWYY